MEIERKFLTPSLPKDVACCPKKHLSQCYIATSPTIRIRQSDGDFFLTVKGKGLLAREEWELPLTKEEYLHLLPKAEGNTVEKDRYFFPLPGGLTAEVDVYFGPLSGLITTEVEFSSLEEANAFLPPAWFGPEITEDVRYTNSALAKNGLPEK